MSIFQDHNLKKSALVLIDWQMGILNLNQAPQKNQVHKNVVALVKQFQEKGAPVAFVTVYPDGKWLQTPKDIPSSNQNLPADFTAPHADLKPTCNDWQIRKHQWSAFVKTELHEILQKNHIERLFFAGISTSIGVEGSARDASPLGYELLFVEDALLDMNPKCHEHSITHIFPRIGCMTKLKDIVL